MRRTFLTLLLFVGIINGCSPTENNSSNDYLLVSNNIDDQSCGYLNIKGDTIISSNKYLACFTDTFRNYALVATETEVVAIDRQEKVLYQVFLFDNGPDEPSEGLFRIMQNNKMGFADAVTGKIVIQPTFDCAFPFENGKAKVSANCSIQTDGEHSTWESNDWTYINKAGEKVEL